MPTIDFERLDWEDYPSTETPLSAENLNRLEDAMEGIYDDVGGQEQAISNILGNFAYVEPTSTASKDYLAGDLLVRGDYMYKAIIPIQTDDALVEGTNITKTTVSSELGVDVFSNFAYIERSNVATKNYTVGSHVLLNNILYVVTSAVETGENLVVDMNIEQTTVCDELEKETGSVASAVGYDNITSGLTATNVQDAVDEVSNAEGVSYDNTESGLTATNVQAAVDEVSANVGTWQSGVIASETYGALYGYYNTALKIAFLSWNGNSTAPTAGQKSFTLPAVYTPRQNSTVPVRMGDNMEVRTDGFVRITLTTSAWSGAVIMYPLA